MDAIPQKSPDISCGLHPVTVAHPRTLILGSFPSTLSLRHAEYYGNSRNHFWKILGTLLGFDAGLPYPQRIAILTHHHVALWDVVASCQRPGSADARIKVPVLNDIAGFVTARPTLGLIALNGKTAARFYARVAAGITVPSVTLPSTSPANARMSFDEKVTRWSVILNDP
ncbi:MAG: DNA-deoxyinosine glycosylase [Methanomicrobiales archaeon]|nr:DNA-deoxyinosine glycosylase [Methanomicrobiales archaeon]